MNTTSDRDEIPELNEPELIKTTPTNITKIATPLIGVLTLGLAAVLTNTGLGSIPKFSKLPDEAQGMVGLGLLLMVAALILGVSVIMAAELKARGEVGAANLALRSRAPIVFAPPGAAGSSAGLRVKRQGFGGDDEWLVIGGQSRNGRTELLVARGDDTAVWIPVSEVTNWEVK